MHLIKKSLRREKCLAHSCSLPPIRYLCPSWAFSSLGWTVQLSQAFITEEILLSVHHLHGPVLDSVQYIHVSFVLRIPEMDSALLMCTNPCWAEGKGLFPLPGGKTPPSAAQEAVGVCHNGALLGHGQPADYQDLLGRAAFQLASLQSVLGHGIVPSQVQDLALPLVELHKVPLYSILQPVEVPLDSTTTIWYTFALLKSLETSSNHHGGTTLPYGNLNLDVLQSCCLWTRHTSPPERKREGCLLRKWCLSHSSDRDKNLLSWLVSHGNVWFWFEIFQGLIFLPKGAIFSSNKIFFSQTNSITIANLITERFYTAGMLWDQKENTSIPVGPPALTKLHLLFYSLPQCQEPASRLCWLHTMFSSVLCSVKLLKSHSLPLILPLIPHKGWQGFATGGSQEDACSPPTHQALGVGRDTGNSLPWGKKQRSTRAGINYACHHFPILWERHADLRKSTFNKCIINRKLARSNSTFCYNCCLQRDERRPPENH